MLKLTIKAKITLIIGIITMLAGLNLGKVQYYALVIATHIYKPNIEFSIEQMSDIPDYSRPAAWLSLPEFVDEADITPLGVESINNGSAQFDVFYVHGTGFIDSERWTSSIEGNTASQSNAKFSLANEASIFNSCCNIYAPKYREANLYAFFGLSKAARNRMLDSVYSDIHSAFFNFIAQRNNRKPFFIVSHSQGTQLVRRLLNDLIAHPNITQRIIAVYALGDAFTPLSANYVDSLPYLSIC